MLSPAFVVLVTVSASPDDPGDLESFLAATSTIFLSGPIEAEFPTEDRFEGDLLPESMDPSVDFGGALRFNLQGNTWSDAELAPNRGGFDVFRLNIAGRYSGLVLSAEYRFYAGYQMLKHGYVGYADLFGILTLTVGVLQVPFGILPYASHNYFFNLPYYVGLEDDYDLGGRLKLDLDIVQVDVAFFKNDEGHFTGGSLDSARYSYDLVRVREGELADAGIPEARSLEETNQGNVRVALRLEHQDDLRTELGVSGRFGQTRDVTTDTSGLHWAVAGHIDGDYGWFDLHFEAGYFDLGGVDASVGDPELVSMGAYDAPYAVARRAWFVVANIAVKVPINYGPLESVTFYQDYSSIQKIENRFADSHQATTGALIVAGPLYIYLDAAVGRNHPWLGPNFTSALGPGDSNADWDVRFNGNFGWYF